MRRGVEAAAAAAHSRGRGAAWWCCGEPDPPLAARLGELAPFPPEARRALCCLWVEGGEGSF